MLISKRNFAWVYSSGLFRSRDHPKDATAGSRYAFFLGGSTSGKAVTESSTMQMAAVYSLDTGEAIAGLPLQLYRTTDNGGRKKQFDHLLYHILHDEPKPEVTSFTFRETLMTYQFLWATPMRRLFVGAVKCWGFTISCRTA